MNLTVFVKGARINECKGCITLCIESSQTIRNSSAKIQAVSYFVGDISDWEEARGGFWDADTLFLDTDSDYLVKIH